VATIVIGKNAEFVERHAAEELAAFVEKMSGARLPIREVDADWQSDLRGIDGPAVAVGQAKGNPLLATLIEENLVTDPGALDGHDGYTLASLTRRGRRISCAGGIEQDLDALSCLSPSRARVRVWFLSGR
jgi:hypothetical protein